VTFDTQKPFDYNMSGFQPLTLKTRSAAIAERPRDALR